MIRAYLAAALVALAVAVPLAGGSTLAPSTPAITSSTPPSPANDNNPTLNGTADAGAAIRLYTDNACTAEVAGPIDADATGAFHIQVSVADDSSTTFYATATDPAPQTSPCSGGFPYVEDSTALPPTITSGPQGTVDSNDATFTFSEAEQVAFSCQLDGGGFSDCSSGSASYTGLSDGGHIFEVKAADAAGNESAATQREWTIDTTAPPAPVITDGPADPSGSSDATLTFSDGDPTASFQCRIDSGSFAPCASPQPYSGLADGPHTFRVRAVDPLGHPSAVTTYDWSIDTVHPLVTLTDKPPLLTNRTAASFSFSADRPGSMFQCRLDGGSFDSCTSPKLYNNLGNGAHTFAVRASSLGNVGIATTYKWTIDTVPPRTAITSTPPALSKSGSANFTFTSSEPASSFSCRLNTAGFTPCTSPKTYVGLGDGSYTFRVEAVDAAGNADSSAATYSWTITGVGKGTADISPPRNVTRLRRNVTYGRLQLRWRKPPDADFDHVGVFVSTSPKTQPRTLIYSGRSQTYTNKRFKNGLYYRYRVVSYDHATNASRGNYKVVPPSVLLESPRDGRVVRSPPVLRWSAVRKATFYNVQAYYRGQKVLSAWPKKPRRVLAQRWVYEGRSFSLRKGRYIWYVWPAFGPRAKSHYGQLLGQGTFRVR